jgi:hypothetical protein
MMTNAEPRTKALTSGRDSTLSMKPSRKMLRVRARHRMGKPKDECEDADKKSEDTTQSLSLFDIFLVGQRGACQDGAKSLGSDGHLTVVVTKRTESDGLTGMFPYKCTPILE